MTFVKKGEMLVHVKGTSSQSPVNVGRRSRGIRTRAEGFTLIEVMIVVAIVAVLAAIALPNYADYVKRGKIIEATSALSDMRTRFEQWYLDNRTYAGGCDDDKGKIRLLAQAGTKSFTITCAAAANTYTGTATGIAGEGMGGFAYTIDQANNKVTTGVAPSWGNLGCGWVIRKDGSCS